MENNEKRSVGAIFLRFMTCVILGISFAFFLPQALEKWQGKEPEEVVEVPDVRCKVVSVDVSQHMEQRSATGTGIILAGDKPMVATGVMPSAGGVEVTDYYVTLEDENGMVVQFTVQADVYTALSKKIGDSIYLTPVSREIVGFDASYYSWQGKKLSNPIVIKESSFSEADLSETNIVE